MPVQFTILGSGSNGNCAYLETDEVRLLIDAGFSGRQIRQRLAAISKTPETLTGILITHEHSDHISGLVGLAAKLDVPIYCNRQTREATEAALQIKLNAQLFDTGNSFEIGDVQIDTFSVPHDAMDPVGFFLHTPAAKIGFLTDLGHCTKMIMERVRKSNVLVLETNHDVQMLQDCPKRPWSLKQRILSRHGHLSNEAAADVVEHLVCSELRQIYLGHLSRDCNKPEIAHSTIAKRLEKIGASHIAIQVTSQNEPCPTLRLENHTLASVPEMLRETLSRAAIPNIPPAPPAFIPQQQALF